MKPFADLTGKQFGMLRVLTHAGTHRHRRHWKVECRCGRSKVVLATNLLQERSKSCGCVARAKASERMRTQMNATAIVKNAANYVAFRRKGMTDAEARAAMERAYDQAVCRKSGR